jgi:hypothetical protein
MRDELIFIGHLYDHRQRRTMLDNTKRGKHLTHTYIFVTKDTGRKIKRT